MTTPLKLSIQHWERLSDPDLFRGEDLGARACALCRKYIEDHCVGCPVSDFTGQPGCQHTPYEDVVDALAVWEEDPCEETLNFYLAAAKSELDFLRNLEK